VSEIPQSPRATIPGSERALPPEFERLSAAPDPLARATVSILVRPRKALPAIGSEPVHVISREAYAREYGASREDLDAVHAFAKDANLTVTASDAARRTVAVEGTLADLAAAFGTTLSMVTIAGGAPFRARAGALTVPAAIGDIVRGVFGLDERVQARRHSRPAARAQSGVSPVAVADAYGFPAGDGTGQTIALVELGGGYRESDLRKFFKTLKIATPTVTSVSVDSAKNAPTGSANGPDAEVMLDIEVAGAVAPAATIVAYFAPNTDQGFLDAVTTAIHDTKNAPSIVSISWGGPESTWTAQATQNFDDAFAAAAMLGITVTVAAGDNGSTDGLTDGLQHVDFPASSPHVLACGGTTLAFAKTAIVSEVVWNDGSSGGATGGGVSDVFALPTWQSSAKVPASANPGARVGRGVPDVAANADPETGYDVVVDGSATVIGGTSAVAPLWAGLVARINANGGKNVGFINPQLYASPSALRDITSGDNGAYAAGPGWDACTGLGSPDGPLLESLLAPTAIAKKR
jgi:kumamolisin